MRTDSDPSDRQVLLSQHPTYGNLQVDAHVRDKIRQQLQVLRDLNLLEFLAPGSYRLR